MWGWAQSWMQDILAHALQQFVDVEKESLHFSLRNGVLMSNVKLKTDTLEELPGMQLPVAITNGKIDSLQLKVPWMNFISGKIVLSVSGVHIVFAERCESDWEGTKATAREQAMKRAMLASFELELLSRALDKSENGENRVESESDSDSEQDYPNENTSGSSRGFSFGALTTSILKNIGKFLLAKLVVCVEDVRVQYQEGQERGEIDEAPASSSDVPSSEFNTASIHLRLGKLRTLKEDKVASSFPASDTQGNGEIMPATLVMVDAFCIYHTYNDSSGNQNEIEILHPASCELRVNVFHAESQGKPSELFDISCRISSLDVSIDKHFIQHAMGLIDKLEVWQLRSTYGKFRPVKWRTTAHGALSPEDRGLWAREGWHYAYQAVLYNIHKKKTSRYRIDKMKTRHPLGCFKYMQYYENKLRALVSGVQRHHDQDEISFLHDFEAREYAEDIISLRQAVEHQLDPNWISSSKNNENSLLSSFWHHWMDTRESDSKYSSPGPEGGTGSPPSKPDFRDIQKFYDKIVSQFPRTPRASRTSNIDYSQDATFCFVVEVTNISVSLVQNSEVESISIVCASIPLMLVSLQTFEDDIAKVKVRISNLSVHAGKTIILEMLDSSLGVQESIHLGIEVSKVGVDKHLSINASCVLQSLICFPLPEETLEQLASLAEPQGDTYHQMWLKSANNLESKLAKYKAKAEYLMQYPCFSLQVLITDVYIVVAETSKDVHCLLKLQGFSATSSRMDTKEVVDRARRAFHAVEKNKEDASAMVEENCMYHTLVCTISGIEAGFFHSNNHRSYEDLHIQHKIISTSLWTEIQLLLLPDDKSLALCKVNVDFSSLKINLSVNDVELISGIVNKMQTNNSNVEVVEKEESNSFVDVRVRFPSITMTLHGFQGIKRPLKDILKVSIKGLKSGILSNMSKSESFLSLSSVKIEQKTEMFSYILLKLSLQELLQGNQAYAKNKGDSSDILYENSLKSFERVSPDKRKRSLCKGSLTERTWMASSISLVHLQAKDGRMEESIVINAFCACVNVRLIECILNVVEELSTLLGSKEKVPAITKDQKPIEKVKLCMHISITNYVIQMDMSSRGDEKCFICLPRINSDVLFKAGSMDSVKVEENGLSMHMHDYHGKRNIITRADIIMTLSMNEISKEHKHQLMTRISIPHLEIAVHDYDIDSLQNLLDSLPKSLKENHDEHTEKSNIGIGLELPVDLSLELEYLRCDFHSKYATNVTVYALSKETYVKVRVIDGLLENFECGWKLQGIYVTFVDSFKMKQDFLLASLEPKEECFEKPIIEVSTDPSCQKFQSAIKNVRVNLNVFGWDFLLQVVDEYRSSLGSGIDNDDSSVPKAALSLNEFYALADDLEIYLHFRDTRGEISAPVLIKTKMDIKYRDCLHEICVEACIHNLVIHMPQMVLDSDEEICSSLKTFAFFDRLLISLKLSDTFDTVSSNISLESLSLWLSHHNLSFLKMALSSQIHETQSSDRKDASTKDAFPSPSIDISFNANKIAALFSDDQFQRDVPVAELVLLDLGTQVAIDPLSMSRCFASCCILLDFYNYDKVAWEPVLEKWPLHLYYRRLDSNDIHRKNIPRQEIVLQSQDSLNINISEYSIETGNVLFQMLHSVNKVSQSSTIGPTISSNKYTPYWLQNQTGITVNYCFTDGNSSSINLVDVNATDVGKAIDGKLVPLYIKKSSARGGRHVSYSYMSRNVAKKGSYIYSENQQWVKGRRPLIHFQLENSEWSEAFAMNAYDKHSLKLQLKGNPLNVICDIQRRENGGRLILLHSNISMTNHCNSCLQIASCLPLSGEPEPLKTLSPNESFWIPANVATSGSIYFRIMSDFGESNWSEQIYISEVLDHKAGSIQPFVSSCHYQRRESFSFVLKVDEFSPLEYNIGIEPPIRVQNWLPVPIDAVLYRGDQQLLKKSIKPDSYMNIHDAKQSSQLSLFLRPLGYNWGPGIAMPFNKGEHEEEENVLTQTMFEQNIFFQGIGMNECNSLLVGAKYIGDNPLLIQLSCPMWIYNHSGLDLSVCDRECERQYQQVLPLWNWPSLHTSELDGSSTLPPEKAHSNPGGLSLIPELAKEKKSSRIKGISPSPPPSSTEIQGNSSPWPTMYGTKFYQHDVKLQLKVNLDLEMKKKLISKPFTLEVLGEPVMVQIFSNQDEEHNVNKLPRAYLFTLTTEISPSGGSSVCVHIRPRYIFTNNLKHTIFYRQEGSKCRRELKAGSSKAIHTDCPSDHVKLSIQLKDSGCQWSGYFHLDKPGGIQMRLGAVDALQNMMFQVDVAESNFETWTISISDYKAGFAPYRIDNFTGNLLYYYQVNCESAEETVHPYSSAIYTWVEPYMSHKIAIKLPGFGLLGSFSLDEVGQVHFVSVPVMGTSRSFGGQIHKNLQMVVRADGPTRVLAISDLSVHIPQENISRIPISSKILGIPGIKQQPTVIQQKQDGQIYFDMKLAHVGLSVIGKTSDIMYVGFLGLQYEFNGGDKHDEISFKVRRIQIDNMLSNATFPVLLSLPAPLYQGDSSSRSSDALNVTLSYWHVNMKDIICIENLLVDVSPIALDMDGSILLHLHQFTEVLLWVKQTAAMSRISSENSIAVRDEDSIKQQRLYFECMRISPVHITVSFSAASLYTEKVALLDIPKGLNGQLLYALSFAEFEGVQVLLSAFELHHPLIDPNILQSLLGKHYIRALLREAVKILGSANVLGDPLGLVNHLGTGMWDFLSKSTLGLFQSARTLGVSKFTAGLSAGSYSLLSHTVYAVSNAAWKISKTAHRNVTAIKNKCDMLIDNGGTLQRRSETSDSSILGALSKGVGGIVAAPIRGVERNGFQGLIEGTTLGVLGAFASPTATILDFAQHTSKSLRDAAQKGIMKVERLRPPRKVSADLPLHAYSHNEAWGHLLLQTAYNGRFQDEILLYSCVLEDNTCLVLTQSYVLSFRLIDKICDFVCKINDMIHHEQDGLKVTLYAMLPLNNSTDILYKFCDTSGTSNFPLSQKAFVFQDEEKADDFERCIWSHARPVHVHRLTMS